MPRIMREATRRTANFEFVQNVFPENSPELKRGDTIVVKTLRNTGPGEELYVTNGSFYIFVTLPRAPRVSNLSLLF